MKKSILYYLTTHCFLIFLSLPDSLQASLIKTNAPKEYTVTEGDTLWEISGKFVKSPWLWKKVWHSNNLIDNPNSIYPGDILSLITINGQKKLTITQRSQVGRVIKLSPKIHIKPLDNSIKTIPIKDIQAFFKKYWIDNTNTIQQQSSRFTLKDNKSMISVGDEIYIQGLKKNIKGNTVSFFRHYQKIYDQNHNFLGSIINHIGNASIIEQTDTITTAKIIKQDKEIRKTDLILNSNQLKYQTNFLPSISKTFSSGSVISLLENKSISGKFHNILINKGTVDGLKQGNVIFLYKKSIIGSTKSSLKTLDKKIGVAIIYQTFEKLSFALVLSSTKDVRVGNIVKNPNQSYDNE